MQICVRTAIVAIISILAAGCSAAPEAAKPGPPAFPPVPVSIGQATEELVPIQIQSVGNVEAYSTVEIKAQVAGPLLTVNFAEGAIVNKGDLLFEIDPRPFREAVRQAEAAIAKDGAQLRVAEANLARSRAQLQNAKAEWGRFEQLSKEGISTRQQEDQVRTAAEVAENSSRADEASIESIRATLESDQAALEQAKLNLGYCEIRSPITGRAGNLLVHPGNLVKANGDSPMVVINQISPVFVMFGVPERYLGRISAQNAQHKLAVEVSPNKDSKETIRGTLAVIDNTVDSTTGTIRLKALFDNKDGRLWPGQFVNFSLTLQTEKAVVIPSEAVQVGQNGSFVYFVKADQTVEPRPVSVGQTAGGRVIIERGIASGDNIVTDGQSRLFPGAKVVTASAPANPATPAAK